MRLNKKAQSVLEYTLILAVLVGVIIAVLLGVNNSGGLKKKVQDAYDNSTNAITNTSNETSGHGIFGAGGEGKGGGGNLE